MPAPLFHGILLLPPRCQPPRTLCRRTAAATVSAPAFTSLSASRNTLQANSLRPCRTPCSKSLSCGSTRSRPWFDSKQTVVRLEAARGSTRSSTSFDSKHNATAMQSACQHNPFLLPTHTFGRTKPLHTHTHAAVRCRPIWPTHITLSAPCPPQGIILLPKTMKKNGAKTVLYPKKCTIFALRPVTNMMHPASYL